MDLRDTIDLVEASTRPAKLETTPLPYGPKDLAPVMSADTIDYHFEHLAKGYAKSGMTAYVALQESEFGMEDQGYTATRHQREVGTGYFDLLAQIVGIAHRRLTAACPGLAAVRPGSP